MALGASLGASLASRINLAPLAGIAVLAAGIRAGMTSSGCRRTGEMADGMLLSTLLQATLFRLLVMGLVTVAVFRVAQPYAFGGTNLLDFSFAAKWRDNMRSIQQLISGAADYPPGHQWASRTPFVFPFVIMVYWGLGLPLGITAWVGWAVAICFKFFAADPPHGDKASTQARSRTSCPWSGSAACSSGRVSSTSSPCATCCRFTRCWR